MCQVADATIEVLSKQCQELQGEIDHLTRELGILPHQLTGIVPYIKNLV
jgi:prefoldin subunit 5